MAYIRGGLTAVTNAAFLRSWTRVAVISNYATLCGFIVGSHKSPGDTMSKISFARLIKDGRVCLRDKRIYRHSALINCYLINSTEENVNIVTGKSIYLFDKNVSIHVPRIYARCCRPSVKNYIPFDSCAREYNIYFIYITRTPKRRHVSIRRIRVTYKKCDARSTQTDWFIQYA